MGDSFRFVRVDDDCERFSCESTYSASFATLSTDRTSDHEHESYHPIIHDPWPLNAAVILQGPVSFYLPLPWMDAWMGSTCISCDSPCICFDPLK